MLNEYAHAQGINVKVAAMDEQSKAILTYHYLMDKTKDIQAAAIKDSGDLSDSIKTLTGKWDDFKLALGGSILADTNDAVKNLTSAFDANKESILQAADAFGQALVGAMNAVVQAAPAIISVLSTILNVLTPVVEGIGKFLNLASNFGENMAASAERFVGTVTGDKSRSRLRLADRRGACTGKALPGHDPRRR